MLMQPKAMKTQIIEICDPGTEFLGICLAFISIWYLNFISLWSQTHLLMW